MILVINFCFFFFIITELNSNETTKIKKDDNHLQLLEQLKQMDEKKWFNLGKEIEKNIADFIKKESEPLHILFSQETKIDIYYYEKINNFVTSWIKNLNDELEINSFLDEAIDFLYQENITSPDMILTKKEKKKITIDTVQLDDLKSNDFYFNLLKENIQLYHLNMFIFIRQNITSDKKEGCYFLIEFVNYGLKKSVVCLPRNRKNSGNFNNPNDCWKYIIDVPEPSKLKTEQRQNKEKIGRIEKIVDEIFNEEKELDFILSFFQNSKLLNLVMNHIFYIKKKIYVLDTCVQPNSVLNYNYYEFSVKTNKKFKDYVLYLILKKKEWTQYKFFYIFDNQKYVNKIKLIMN